MTIKEIADICEVDKRTVSNKIKKLHIEPQLVLNRYELSEEQAKAIIKKIHPKNYQEYFTKADFKKTENTKSGTDNGSYDKKISTDKAENAAETADNNANIGANTAEINKELIEMLKSRLSEQDNVIKAQQNTIDNLVKANAALSATIARIEDKSQPQQEEHQETVIVSEQKQEEQEQKKSWIDRLFKR